MKYLNFANHINTNEKPETLLMLMDISDSMLAHDIRPSRMEAAINANEEIIKVKSRHYYDDKIGIIVFQKSAELVSFPTLASKIGNVRHFIDEIGDADMEGGTDFVAPLKLAYQCFFGVNLKTENGFLSRAFSNLFCESVDEKTVPSIDTSGTIKRIILLTDGAHLGDDNPVRIATRLKNAGVIIDCIGIGGRTENVDEKLLKQIASQDSYGSIRYCFIGDQETLVRKYNSLAQHIRPV